MLRLRMNVGPKIPAVLYYESRVVLRLFERTLF